MQDINTVSELRDIFSNKLSEVCTSVDDCYNNLKPTKGVINSDDYQSFHAFLHLLHNLASAYDHNIFPSNETEKKYGICHEMRRIDDAIRFFNEFVSSILKFDIKFQSKLYDMLYKNEVYRVREKFGSK